MIDGNPSSKRYGDVFRNEILVKFNHCRRASLNELECSFFVLNTSSLFKSAFLRARFNVASLLGLVFIIFSRKLSFDCRRCFFYLDPRLKGKNVYGGAPARVGLHNIRNFEDPHVYQVLPFWKLMVLLFKVIPFREELRESILEDAVFYGGVNRIILMKFANLSYFRVLDFLMALESFKSCPDLCTAGHFDIYTALASKLRVDGYVKYFCGAQHGLYEIFSSEMVACKLYFDEYQLLFRESAPFFKSSLSSNEGLKVSFRENNIEYSCFYETDKPIVAYGMQNDNFSLDLSIIEFLAESMDGYLLVVYVHPGTSNGLMRKFNAQCPNVIFQKIERYKNINILVTRYSTIGMDYAGAGVPAIFIFPLNALCIGRGRNKLIRFVDQPQAALDAINDFLILGASDA